MPRNTFVIDERRRAELEELKNVKGESKSRIIREAIEEFYLKEKRARENLDFFIDLYNRGIITKDLILLLLPKKEAESVIIGSKTGKEAAEVAREIGS